MRRFSGWIAPAIAVLGLTVLVGACGSSGAASAKASSPSSATITIHNFNFGAPITVKMGATVTVKNSDSTAHTVTADNKSFDTGPIPAGKTAMFVVKTAGTVKFHCNIHNYMTGSIQVTG